jgi:dynactin-4
MCGWCHWSSLDIGITFEKPNNLTAQLNKIKLSRRKKLTAETAEKGDDSTEEEPPDQEDENDIAKAAQRVSDPEELFLRLSTFYRQQVTESSDSPFPGGYTSSDMAFSSPSTISRLLNMYSGKRTKRLKPKPMREALTSEEGLLLVDEASEQAVIERQFEEGFSGTTDTSQRAFQPGGSPRFVSDLWPVASLLRTKRQKRCKTCRTLLVKPEARMTSSRWRIRLLALNHIPKINLRALTAPAVIGPYLGQPQAPGVSFEYETLQTGKTYQFLLTAVNPLFDPINVTLATATTTPGRVGSRITILCPQFTVGANSDVWDEALGGASKRRSVMPGAMQPAAIGEDDSQKQVEAGNVWRKGRNWASVIMEVVPGMLPAKDELEEDEDLLEIAVFVHIEYETAAAGDDKQVGVSINAPKEKRETAFWSVLGAGRIRNS